MTDHVFKDWMEAAAGSKEPTTQEADIIKDYVSCKNTISQIGHRD
jgi:hypothetical protein